MKLLYATSIEYPSNKANRLQIIQMSFNFQRKLNKNFVLGGNKINLDHDYISLNTNNFFAKKSYILAWKYLKFIIKENITHIYSREEKLLLFIILYNKLFFRRPLKFIYEAHFVPENMSWWYKWVLKNQDKIIVLTSYIKKELAFFVPENRIIIAPDAVNLNIFDIDISKHEARKRLNLPLTKKIVMYTGSFFYHKWKGVDVLLEASKFLAEDVIAVLVGSNNKEKEKILSDYKKENILIIGRVPHSQIPIYLKAADVLVLPNKKGKAYSELYTSPLKLFEYMASKVPIVASNLPSIRDILNDSNAQLVEPSNPKELAFAIEKVIKDKNLADSISDKARVDVNKYTWSNRAEHILNKIVNV